MAGFTPVSSMVQNNLPDYIGVDQLKRKNALADQQAMIARQGAETDQMNAQSYRAQLDAQTQARTQQATEQQAAQAREWLGNAVQTVRQNPALIPALVREGKMRGVLTGEIPDNITPEQVEEFALRYGIAPQQQAVPFDQTPEAAKIRLQGQQAIELERLRQRAPRGAAAGGGGNGAPPKPLPVGALRLVDEAKQAITATGESLAIVDRAIQKIEGGEVNLGLASNAKARLRNTLGVSTPESRAFSDIKQTLEKLRNNYLLLAKGVQTEGDAQRAWNSEIGESVQNDNNLAAQQLKKAKTLLERAIQSQNDRIETVYSNYGGAPQDAAPAPAAAAAPKPGMVQDGYRYKGGDPGSPSSWVKVEK